MEETLTKKLEEPEVWFMTGIRHPDDEKVLKRAQEHSLKIAASFQNARQSVKVLLKPVLTSPNDLYNICEHANESKNCIGIIAWSHTASLAKMWAGDFKILHKPLLHLRKRLKRDIAWDEVSLDFMNLDQQRYGNIGFAGLMNRLPSVRKVVIGHWEVVCFASN